MYIDYKIIYEMKKRKVTRNCLNNVTFYPNDRNVSFKNIITIYRIDTPGDNNNHFYYKNLFYM